MAEQSEGPLNIDVELEELEYRLERLRSLYEQYFLGIEKIEPGVARKDVDRRIWLLRREKFRNTAKRFKLQTLIQRYNTYQQHWSRICREIELGTFKRHLLKAEKILAQDKPKERKEEAARTAGAVRDVESEIARALQKGADLGDGQLDELLGLRTPTGMRAAAVVPSSAAPGAAGARPATRSRVQVEKLDLDLDDLLGGGAAPIGSKPRNPAPEPSVPSNPRPSSPSHARPPPPVGPMAAAPRMPKGLAPPVSRPDAAPPPPPARGAPPPPPVPSRSPGPPPVPPRSGPPPVPQRPAPPPVPSRPAAPPPGPPAAPARPAAQAAGGLSDARVRELHARLSDAKRQVRDEKAISVDGLARQLRQAEQDLRQRHGARSVDFDVVIKDGRAIVKPVVKK